MSFIKLHKKLDAFFIYKKRKKITFCVFFKYSLKVLVRGNVFNEGRNREKNKTFGGIYKKK